MTDHKEYYELRCTKSNRETVVRFSTDCNMREMRENISDFLYASQWQRNSGRSLIYLKYLFAEDAEDKVGE
jgi:hypothetical protein